MPFQGLRPAMLAASETIPELAPDKVFDATLPEGLELRLVVELSKAFKFASLRSAWLDNDTPPVTLSSYSDCNQHQ